MEFSRSATPIVPVPKRDGTFHPCGDSKVTLNAALEVDKYPISTPGDICDSIPIWTSASLHSSQTINLSLPFGSLPCHSSQVAEVGHHLVSLQLEFNRLNEVNGDIGPFPIAACSGVIASSTAVVS